MQKRNNTIKTSRHNSLEKYTSHFIERIVLQHIDPPPNTSGYNSIYFPCSWAAQLEAWGPSICWDMVLIPASFLQLIWSSCHRGYIIIWHPPTSCERHNSHSIQPVDSQDCPLISSAGCTCYLHMCILSFDSLAGVNMWQLENSEIRRQVNTIQSTTLLRSARILRRVLDTWGDLLSLKLQW